MSSIFHLTQVQDIIYDNKKIASHSTLVLEYVQCTTGADGSCPQQEGCWAQEEKAACIHHLKDVGEMYTVNLSPLWFDCAC